MIGRSTIINDIYHATAFIIDYIKPILFIIT